MADASQDRRKRALTDLSNAPLARPLKAVFLAPSAPELEPQPAAAAPVAGSQAQQAAGDQAAKPEQMLSEAAAPEASRPASNDASSDSDVSATSPSTPSPRCEQSEQQSAYLLMKACEREEAAEDRAEQAEEALETSNRKLQEAEAALEVAQERVKLLEVQLLNRAVSHAKLDCIKAADSDCLTISEDGKSQDSDASAASDMHLHSASEEWHRRPGSFDWDSAQVDSETVQLRLELESTHARLTMSRESEQKATEFAEAAGTRLEAFAGMLRGAADVAFCGNDASARRLRHHLFRCLDVDCDGFLGGGDLQHWYRVSEHFLETQGYDPVSFEALQAQLADALYNPTLPAEFQCRGKVSLMQLSRSNMGAGIIATLLNLDNLMQDRNTSEWGAHRAVPLS